MIATEAMSLPICTFIKTGKMCIRAEYGVTMSAHSILTVLFLFYFLAHFFFGATNKPPALNLQSPSLSDTIEYSLL